MRLRSHGFAHIVDLGLSLGETVHESLVLGDQLPDDLQVVRQRLLFEDGEVLLLPYQPLHQLVKEGEQLKQLLEMLLQLLLSLKSPRFDLVPSGLDDGYPVLDDLHSVWVTLLENLLSKIDGVILVLPLFL